MKGTTVIILVFVTIALYCCTSAQISQTLGDVNKVLESEVPLSNAEVGEGLKEALIKGVISGADLVSKVDGHFWKP